MLQKRLKGPAKETTKILRKHCPSLPEQKVKDWTQISKKSGFRRAQNLCEVFFFFGFFCFFSRPLFASSGIPCFIQSKEINNLARAKTIYDQRPIETPLHNSERFDIQIMYPIFANCIYTYYCKLHLMILANFTALLKCGMSFQHFFLQLEWHGDGFGSYCDLANFSDVSKSRVSDDIDLAHFCEGVYELFVEKEIRGSDLSEMGAGLGISSKFVVDAEQSSSLFHVPEVAQIPFKLWLEVQRHVGIQTWVWGVSCVRTNFAEVIAVSRVQVGIRQPRAQEVVETIHEEAALSNTYGVRSCKNSQHWVSKKEQHIHETFESDILLWRCWSWWLIRTMWHAILSSFFLGWGPKFSYWRESKGRCKG